MKTTQSFSFAVKSALTAALALFVFVAMPANSRDDINLYSIEEAMNTSDAKRMLNRRFSFIFGTTPTDAIVEDHGQFKSNKRANAFAKSDKAACQRAFLSAMLSFQDRIQREGGNAVVNLRSYFKRHEFSSEQEFECGNGAIMAGVTFLGDVVTLKNDE